MKSIIKKIKRLVKRVLPVQAAVQPAPLDRHLRILGNEYLREVGWTNSVEKMMAIDKDHRPIPWFTYSAISFLKPRLKKSFEVFEYGSGNSTLWFSQYVSKVVSVEHDSEWYTKMDATFRTIDNITYYQKGLEQQEYGTFIAEFTAAFDIVVIDGQDRITCAKNVLGALKNDGVVIWDNSDRTEYEEGYQFLIDNGFKRLDFNGLGPINHYGWGTSIFYRDTNILGL